LINSTDAEPEPDPDPYIRTYGFRSRRPVTTDIPDPDPQHLPHTAMYFLLNYQYVCMLGGRDHSVGPGADLQRSGAGHAQVCQGRLAAQVWRSEIS
jgi:hypothetical protein